MDIYIQEQVFEINLFFICENFLFNNARMPKNN